MRLFNSIPWKAILERSWRRKSLHERITFIQMLLWICSLSNILNQVLLYLEILNFTSSSITNLTYKEDWRGIERITMQQPWAVNIVCWNGFMIKKFEQMKHWNKTSTIVCNIRMNKTIPRSNSSPTFLLQDDSKKYEFMSKLYLWSFFFPCKRHFQIITFL